MDPISDISFWSHRHAVAYARENGYFVRQIGRKYFAKKYNQNSLSLKLINGWWYWK